MVDMLAPTGGCGMGEETVTVEIENLSGVAVSDVPVGFQWTVVRLPKRSSLRDRCLQYLHLYLTGLADGCRCTYHSDLRIIPGDIDGGNDDMTNTHYFPGNTIC